MADEHVDMGDNMMSVYAFTVRWVQGMRADWMNVMVQIWMFYLTWHSHAAECKSCGIEPPVVARQYHSSSPWPHVAVERITIVALAADSHAVSSGVPPHTVVSQWMPCAETSREDNAEIYPLC